MVRRPIELVERYVRMNGSKQLSIRSLFDKQGFANMTAASIVLHDNQAAHEAVQYDLELELWKADRNLA